MAKLIGLASLPSLLLLACTSASPPAPETPAGRFPRTVYLEAAPAASANLSFGDLNGDGHLDVVLAKGRHWPLVDRVHLGDGRGGFDAGRDLGATADRTYSTELADLDGDGDLDVVVSNDRPDPKRVYLNDGTGHFQEGGTFGEPEWVSRQATVADVDGDGRPDVVVANRSGGDPGASYVCLNRSNPGAARFDAACERFTQLSATSIAAADVNRDGRVDLIVPHRDGGQSLVYLNESQAGQLAFRTVPFGPPDATKRIAQAADLDRDGWLDLVTTDERRGVTAYLGSPAGRFSEGLLLRGATPPPYALLLGDVDLDGAVDVVVGYVEARPVVFRNDGTGRGFTPEPFGDAEGAVYGFALGDLDEDGRPDLGVARSDARNVVYLTRR